MREVRGLAATMAFRWTAAVAGSFAVMAVLLLGFIYWQTAVHERQRIDDLIMRERISIAGGKASDAQDAVRRWLASDFHEARYAGLFAPNGGFLAGNLMIQPDGLPDDGHVHRSVFPSIERDEEGKPDVVRATAIRLRDGKLLILGYDLDELEDVEDIIQRALVLGLLPALLLSVLAGTALAMRAQRRIASVHRAISEVARGSLRERLPVRGSGDGLDRLAVAVNGALHEIERLVGEIQSVGDSVAHDLRTPLTRARARLERCRDEVLGPETFRASTDKAIASLDQALGVVTAVLRIGEIEHGLRRAAFESVDPASLLREAAELYEPLAAEKGVAIKLDLSVCANLDGDHDLLLEAVGNLVDNAIKFTPSKSEVVLSLARSADVIHISVADRGPGIPEKEREQVTRRFYRGQRSRTLGGSGLGLSLVAAIVRLHGWHLRIGDTEGGCVIEIVCLTTAPSRLSIGRVLKIVGTSGGH